MFMFKIVFILVISVYVIFATNTCDPSKVTEYQCRDSLCKTTSENGQYLSLNNRKSVPVIGYSKDKFMVKKNSGFDIINKNKLKVINFSSKGWDYLVKINEETHTVCSAVFINNENTSKLYSNDNSNLIENDDNVNITEEISINSSKNEIFGNEPNSNYSELTPVEHFNDSIIVNETKNNDEVINFVDKSSGIKNNNEYNIIKNQNIVKNTSNNIANEGKSDDAPSFTPMENQKSIPENSDDVLEQGNDIDNESEINLTVDYENLSSNDDIKDSSNENKIQRLKETVNSELNEIGDKIELQKSLEPTNDNDKCLLDNCINKLETEIEKKVDLNAEEIDSAKSDIQDENNTFTPNVITIAETVNSEIPEEIEKVEQFDISQINNINDQIENMPAEESNNETVINGDLSIDDNNVSSHVDKLPLNDKEIKNSNEIPVIQKIETINKNIPTELNNSSNSNSVVTTINYIDDDNKTNNRFITENSNNFSSNDEINQPKSTDITENLSNVDSNINIKVKDEISQNNLTMDKTGIQESMLGEVTKASIPNNIQCKPGTDCSDPTASIHTHTYPDNSANTVLINNIQKGSFVSSFGHPESCTGTACLHLINNNEQSSKTNINEPIESTTNQNFIIENLEKNTESLKKEIENLEYKQIIHTNDEWYFMDYVEQWLTSPTMNTVNFVMRFFSNSNTYNDQQIDVFSTEDFGNDENISHRKQMNDNSKIYFIVSAVITLLFSLGYCKYQKGSYENYLLTLLAVKEQSLLIVEQELCTIKEHNVENTTIVSKENSDYELFKNNLAESEDTIESQTIVIAKLQQEVSELTEAGVNMHELFKSALESSEKHKSYVNLTKTKLDESENMIINLREKNLELHEEIEKKCDAIKNLHSINDKLTQKNNKLMDENEKTVSHLEQILADKTKLQKQNNDLQYELNKVNNALMIAEDEASLSKDALQDFISKKFNFAEAKEILFSVKSSAELNSTKKMCEKYQNKIEELIKSNQQSRDQIDTLNNEIVNLKTSYIKLKSSKDEQETKLNVLSKFFKDQEKEYQRQIDEKASLYKNEIGESTNLYKQIEFLNQEISNYKSVNQSLKNEINDQEASFKIQLSAADKKANDNWMAFRQAERKLKEMEIETAQLRNKLTMSDKKFDNGTKSVDSSKDFEDELLDIPLPTVSPDFTLLDFEPPPPIFPTPHTSTDQRLPPLGALGQGPPSPVSLTRRQNRLISPPPPVPLHSSAFRPLPQRYNYLDRQNSLGHSVESLDN
ncbi:transport and Golgi organization protein 1 [Daktulosphaira vitifoliae]|uniref:transport and Golgi organization protein 1 n=1 Tax=Daktulosphaira vitifoliae TaxID=58002 RepID=UPI0021A9A3CB|nr:transport and Golgi organization protein 1 [Daktulosphaira vitifoliae]